METIHDIRPPVAVGLDPFVMKSLVWGLFIFAFAILLYFLIRRYFNKRSPVKKAVALPDALPPFEAAMKALDRLTLQTAGDLRLFYYDLTLILRKYMGATFGIHAAEMTSEEFIRRVRQLDVHMKLKNDLFEFQNRIDQVKYAGIPPEEKRVDNDRSFVRKVISQIEHERVENEQAELHRLSEARQEKAPAELAQKQEGGH